MIPNTSAAALGFSNTPQTKREKGGSKRRLRQFGAQIAVSRVDRVIAKTRNKEAVSDCLRQNQPNKGLVTFFTQKPSQERQKKSLGQKPKPDRQTETGSNRRSDFFLPQSHPKRGKKGTFLNKAQGRTCAPRTMCLVTHREARCRLQQYLVASLRP